MTKYQIVDPGTDILKLDVKRHRLKIPWLYLSCILFAVLVAWGLWGPKPASASFPSPFTSKPTATRDLHGDFTRTPTQPGQPSSTPTGQASPTATATGILDALPGPHVIGSPIANGSNTCDPIEVTRVVNAPAPACNGGGGGSTTIRQEVTRIVPQRVTQLVIVTQLVEAPSSTPGPTATPWVIVVEYTREVTRIVEVTSTPTLTPTATLTPLPPTAEAASETPTLTAAP